MGKTVSDNSEKIKTNVIDALRIDKEKEVGVKINKAVKDKISTVWKLYNGMPYLVKDILNEGRVYADGTNSKFLGKHPIRNSTRRQKFFKPAVESSIFYNRFKTLFDAHGVNVDRGITIKGCWHSNKYTLARQLVPEESGGFARVDGDMNLKQLDRSVRNVIRKLQPECLPKCEKNSLLFSKFNTKTYAGFHYSEFLYKDAKKDAVVDALKLASQRWDVIEKGGFSTTEIFPSLYSIGARNKRDFDYDDGELAASRVVHMPEFHVEMVSGVWTDQITDLIKERKNGPIFIGNSFLESERLQKALENSYYVLEGDWKRFDSTLYLRIITAAVAILRCFYMLDDETIDNHFKAIYDSLAIKDYYTVRGRVFRAFHGLPSGIKSTNLIGSIINLIALDFCCGRNANRKFNYVTGGDDFLVCMKGVEKDVSYFCERFERRAKELGMKLKFLKIKKNNAEDIEDLPCFYKYAINARGEPIIPTSALLERVFMPWNKKYTTTYDIYNFLNDVMPSLAAPSSHLLIFYLYFQFIYFRNFKRKISLADVVTRHIKVYNKMDRKKKMFIKEPEIDFDCIISYITYLPRIYSKSLEDISTFSTGLVTF